MFNPLLQSMGENLRTQDNRITAHPIFLIQQKIRDYGYEEDYATDFDWMFDDESIDDEKEIESLNEKESNGDEIPEGYYRVGYKTRWETVQPFFTEKGAIDYLAINSHNLHETRIYVDSAYRNAEWQAVREFLSES